MTGRKTDGNATITALLMESIVKVLKKVSVDFSESPNIIQYSFDTWKDFEATAIRFTTGENNGTLWNEIVFVYCDELNKEIYNTILMEIYNKTFFKYHAGYDVLYGRLVYIIPNKIKGVFKPKLVVKRVVRDVYSVGKFRRDLYVVLNPNMDKNKVIASALAYLVNYFCKRAINFEAKIFNDYYKDFNIWRKVRLIYSGKLRLLSRAIASLYNYINYRVELLREKGGISETLSRNLKLLIELFFTFAKEFDKYAIKIYTKVMTFKLYNYIKEEVGFTAIPQFCKNIIAVWNRANEYIIRLEAKKILGG